MRKLFIISGFSLVYLTIYYIIYNIFIIVFNITDMWHLWSAVLWWWALVWADYLTWHVGSSMVANWVSTLTWNVAGQVGVTLNWAVANINAPLLWSAAPLASFGALWYGVYRGFSKTSEHGIVRWVQEGTLASWLMLGAGWLTGILGTTALATASPLIATWLGIYGARKAYELSSVFLTAPATHTSNAIKAPFKWVWKAANWARWK